jgi:uncharacterized membrane protein YraQ (UPF0718 family)
VIQYFLSGVFLRSSQIVVDASIWIAFGCFIAAILRNMVGAAKTKSVFGDHSRYGLLIGWAIGMLLPVCSLGVIPVLAELYRVRVKPGTMVAFGLTAPLFNPISVLYGLSLSDPVAILVFAAAAVVIVTSVGAIWGRFVSGGKNLPGKDGPSEQLPATGVRRSMAVLYTASTALVGWSLLYILIGIFASATVAACFPNGSLQGSTEPDDVWAPAFMAIYVTPVYSTPLLAMSQIGGMFQHGNSIGAAFSLLILGAGVNLGVFVWFAVAFGFRRFVVFAGLLFAITLGLAYGLDKPLYPKGVETAGHTHAFDIYTHPYRPADDLLSQAVADAREYRLNNGWQAPFLLLMLGIVGLVFQALQSRWDLEAWLHRPVTKTTTNWDIVLPSWVIGLVACGGLVIASIFGTYLYYPEANSLLEDLSAINATCVAAARSGDYEVVESTVPYCDDLSRRLEVGVFLRTGSVSEFKRTKAKIYREKLDNLRDHIVAGQTENVGEMAIDLLRTFQQMGKAFRAE